MNALGIVAQHLAREGVRRNRHDESSTRAVASLAMIDRGAAVLARTNMTVLRERRRLTDRVVGALSYIERPAGPLRRGEMRGNVVACLDSGNVYPHELWITWWNYEDEPLVKRLLNAGVDPDRPGPHLQGSPIARSIGFHRIAKTLLESGANPDGLPRETPLNLAIATRSAEATKTFELLLEFGADPNKQDIRGNGALHEALRMGTVQMANRVLDVPSVDVNKRNLGGQTALFISLPKRSASSVTGRLLSMGARVDLKDGTRDSLLHMLLAHGYGYTDAQVISTIDMLLQRGVDVNAKNVYGRTALMYSVRWNVPVIRRLLNAPNIDVDARDMHRQTALDIFRRSSLGTPEKVEVLLRFSS